MSKLDVARALSTCALVRLWIANSRRRSVAGQAFQILCICRSSGKDDPYSLALLQLPEDGFHPEGPKLLVSEALDLHAGRLPPLMFVLEASMRREVLKDAMARLTAITAFLCAAIALLYAAWSLFHCAFFLYHFFLSSVPKIGEVLCTFI